MKTRMLAVMPNSLNYASFYEVSVADSFEQARRMLMEAEAEGTPFEAMDLPVGDEGAFWDFLDWMRMTGRKYPFSIFGNGFLFDFQRIVRKARARGFTVNT